MCSSSLRPVSQSSVSRRPVDSSGQTFGTRIASSSFSMSSIERDVPRLADVVELLAQARSDLDRDLARVDRRIETLADREQQLQLTEVGLDRRLHVGILQLAGKLRCRRAPCHDEPGRAKQPPPGDARILKISSASRRRARPHAPLDESPAHRRRLTLQLHQLVGVFRRQRIGNGGEQLRHLHDRALEPAERRGKFERIGGAVERHAKEPRACEARGDAAKLRADAGIAPGAGREAVLFAVGGRHRRAHSHHLISFSCER